MLRIYWLCLKIYLVFVALIVVQSTSTLPFQTVQMKNLYSSTHLMEGKQNCYQFNLTKTLLFITLSIRPECVEPPDTPFSLSIRLRFAKEKLGGRGKGACALNVINAWTAFVTSKCDATTLPSCHLHGIHGHIWLSLVLRTSFDDNHNSPSYRPSRFLTKSEQKECMRSINKNLSLIKNLWILKQYKLHLSGNAVSESAFIWKKNMYKCAWLPIIGVWVIACIFTWISYNL